jgi:amino-acid N-acetyltransferase
LKNFGPSPYATAATTATSTSVTTSRNSNTPAFPTSETSTPTTAFVAHITGSYTVDETLEGKTELADELLHSDINRHTALVKIQGPFTDRQLDSIAEGMVYLKKLGLVSIIVLDSEDWEAQRLSFSSSTSQETIEARETRVVKLREEMKRETLKFAEMLEAKGGDARPLLEGVLCVAGASFEKTWTPITPTNNRSDSASPASISPSTTTPFDTATSDLFVDSLSGIRDAIRRGEIPVIPPIALDASCFSLCVSANDAVRAISSGLADHGRRAGLRYDSEERLSNDVDLTPVRIMVINREGGIPSPARAGNPHLSINLEAEFDYIHKTFIWGETHPTSLKNLELVRACLAELPRTASAVLVSHRSNKSLIANLITNKPAHSPSLHYSLLRDDNLHNNPTIVRRGLSVRVFKSLAEIDQTALTKLLEASFGRALLADEFYQRLERDMDFIIVAGDYEGVAIVTNERLSPTSAPLAYLDKFAVLPSLQGDGTVDFLWGALRDESFGLGSLDSLNPNVGGLQGLGESRDLIWRSRDNNPVNKWYFERSNGFFKIPPPSGSSNGFAMFWCEAEGRRDEIIEEDEGQVRGRVDVGLLEEWADTVGRIPSCWA